MSPIYLNNYSLSWLVVLNNNLLTYRERESEKEGNEKRVKTETGQPEYTNNLVSNLQLIKTGD